MKKFLLLTATLVSHLFISAQVLIDDSQNSDETPHPKAILELRSTSKGLLLPRVEGTNAITSPQIGMIVFDKTDNSFKGYNGTDWVAFSPANLTPTASNINFTGDLIVGQELQGTYTYSGGTEGTSLYSWKSASDTSGTEESEIANTQNYMLTSTEVGKYVQFCVMPVDNNDEMGELVCSDWKGPIQDNATPPTSVVLLQETFDGLAGSSTSTGGSSSHWTDENENFPTSGRHRAYQAGDAIRLGAGKDTGHITSKVLEFNGGNVTVTLDVKGWSSVEGDIIVSIGNEEQTINYINTMSDSFETKSVTFPTVTGTNSVKITTSSKRAFIDNIIITKE